LISTNVLNNSFDWKTTVQIEARNVDLLKIPILSQVLMVYANVINMTSIETNYL